MTKLVEEDIGYSIPYATGPELLARGQSCAAASSDSVDEAWARLFKWLLQQESKGGGAVVVNCNDLLIVLGCLANHDEEDE